MFYIINKNLRVIFDESLHEFFITPYIHLMFMLGVELTFGWLQYSITLSYSSDRDNDIIEQIRKGGNL